MKKLKNKIKFKLAVWNLRMEINKRRRMLQQFNVWDITSAMDLSLAYKEELEKLKEIYGQK